MLVPEVLAGLEITATGVGARRWSRRVPQAASMLILYILAANVKTGQGIDAVLLKQLVPAADRIVRRR